MGAGTTSVVVQPSTDTVTVGNTTTVDIVVTSATDGVGSLDIDITSTNGSVATVSNTTVAGNPETVQTSQEANSVRIAATGMDTADSGSTSVVSVTLTGEAVGTSNVDLTVAAVGDEFGNAYNVTSVRDGTLTVESGDNTTTPTETPTPTPTSTPTETPTDTDSSSSGDSNGDDDSDDDDSDSGSSDSGDTATPTDAPTVTETTSSDTPTTTTATTEQRTETATPSQTSSGGPAITPDVTNTPSQTRAADSVESSGSSPTNLLVGGSILVAVLGGLIIYRRL
ncbi:hypothetical protein [Haloarcula japonica]|uniref:Uncharacterized protein n=1 Tax=Haloarcula japonica (strain ATCC 49778 / DSM 6131 / JCM 7785 / NBRC 101032 / NCIMB 13157 / TR-1) TaxID=1227453 RepID=M0L0M3_HALJT|nr:hypothetical protein C444_21056 [Haloarcula japonica DSM 6131]